MVKPLRFGLLSFLASLATEPSAIAGEDPQTRSLDILDQELNSELQALITRAKTDNIPPPQIRSDWYVSESGQVPAGILALERQKRQFGRKLLDVLDKTSDEILAMNDSPSRERIAITLLDLGDWIVERPGYGNVFIFERCQDMATVPLAHLIADLNYPEGKLDALTARLRVPADIGNLSAEALNSESPGTIFTPGQSGNVSEVQKPLAQAWGAGFKRARDALKAGGARRNIPEGKDIRATLPADLQFFCDDEILGYHTTIELWDVKNHHRLALGFLGWVNADQIRHFLLFRKKVGTFPPTPPVGWTPVDRFDTPTKAAFDAAWEPYRRDFGPVYSPAASVYTAVITNTFYDQDTTAKRIQKAASASRPASGRPPAGR
ncbi:MAG: hypothetical protein JXQ75_06010, partial [Phycisphaerae bacterium]|nr:hypothetical protein [Phycisphaerae bacterium]